MSNLIQFYLMSAFDQMSKNDQEEYLKLYNSFDHIQSLPAQKHADLKEDLEMRRKILNSIEENSEKVEKMMKIFCIYQSNVTINGVYIKKSRLNHSCRPNSEVYCESDVSKPLNVKTLFTIRAGEEITISYK